MGKVNSATFKSCPFTPNTASSVRAPRACLDRHLPMPVFILIVAHLGLADNVTVRVGDAPCPLMAIVRRSHFARSHAMSPAR